MAKPFSPQTLRGALLILLIAAISGSAGLFYLGLNDLRTFALEVNHSIADANASGTQVQSLQKLKGQLSESEALIAKANQMFATPTNYQSVALTDINNYASAAGLTIAKTSFDETTLGTMTVGLKAPVSYNKLIQFMSSLEGNIPKMHVSDITVEHIKGGTSDSVMVSDIKIMIAIR